MPRLLLSFSELTIPNGAAPVKKLTYLYENFANAGIITNATSIRFSTDTTETWQGALDNAVKLGFKVVRTVTVEGVETTIESKMLVATYWDPAA